MEILIVGVVLVALMAFISTKIKKSAASAFEREIVENDEFRIVKPEGFLNPIKEDSEFAFEAYSKNSGKNDAEKFRQAQATLSVFADSKFEAICENAKKTAGKILSEKAAKNAAQQQNVCFIESEEIKNGVTIITFRKIVESIQKQKIYELQIVVLKNYLEDFAARTEEMLESFVVK